ncbi:MAG: DJ-1/PfpI family protein [Bradyrhizobium sp.]|uniref:DJ-1/PfpI family protein n=1 Tax=Bradyrhizobium sp. TaxID=376 RepID=UPI003C7BD855
MPDQAAAPRTQTVGIFVFDGFEPIDVFGFAEAFSIARFLNKGYGDGPPYPFETVLIARQMGNVKSINGPSVAPDWDFTRALQERLDVLMIPGGGGTWPLLGGNPADVQALLKWVRDMDKHVPIMASVCTGAAVLACAGLLDGRPAATNQGAFGWVAAHGPLVLWDNVSRWVDAGKYVTSAGVSAGTDLGFHLVSRLAGRAVAEIAVSAAEYDWHRDPQAPIFYRQQAQFEPADVKLS